MERCLFLQQARAFHTHFPCKKAVDTDTGQCYNKLIYFVFSSQKHENQTARTAFFRMFFPKNKKLIRGDTAVTERNDTTDAVDGFE